MEATDTIPTFILFAFQGCYAPALFGDPWGARDSVQEVRAVTLPLVFMIVAAASMLMASAFWWREVNKAVPMALIAVAFVCLVGFFGYQVNDVYQNTPSFDAFLTGGNYYIAVGEFSFYLLGVFMMVLVSFILVWREVGWDTERNLLFLGTGAICVMTFFWVLLSRAVWNCI